MVQDATAPDPFVRDDRFRLETLVGHLVPSRVFPDDLVDGLEIVTSGNKTLTVVRGDQQEIILNDGRQKIRVIGEVKYVFNLGNLYFIGKDLV